MEDGKLYIIITDKRPEDSSSVTNVLKSDEKKSKNTLDSWMADKFYDLMKNTVKNTVNFTVNNIGNFTGNYETQRVMQNAVSLGSRVLSIGKAAVGGWVAFGPIGAIVGASISIINQGVQMAEEYLVTKSQEARDNMKVNKLKERSGLYSLGDGSRGTMN